MRSHALDPEEVLRALRVRLSIDSGDLEVRFKEPINRILKAVHVLGSRDDLESAPL
jgi:hypothetical protein